MNLSILSGLLSRSVRASTISAIPVTLLLGTFGPGAAAAGPLFTAPFLSFDVGAAPQSMAIGDLNGDGRPDLTAANFNDGTVSVLLGNGDGTCGPKSDYGTGDRPISVAIGDLNGDGKQDLAVTNFHSGTVSVLLGNGDGTFGPRSEYPTGDFLRFVAIGDLNVSFSLAKAEPAILAVYDVSGRQVMARQVGALGAGRHMVSLGAPGTLAPGIYMVHLVQGSHQLVTRAVVTQ